MHLADASRPMPNARGLGDPARHESVTASREFSASLELSQGQIALAIARSLADVAREAATERQLVRAVAVSLRCAAGASRAPPPASHASARGHQERRSVSRAPAGTPRSQPSPSGRARRSALPHHMSEWRALDKEEVPREQACLVREAARPAADEHAQAVHESGACSSASRHAWAGAAAGAAPRPGPQAVASPTPAARAGDRPEARARPAGRLRLAGPRQLVLGTLSALSSAAGAVVGAVVRLLLPYDDCELCCTRTFTPLLRKNGECAHRCCGACWRRYLETGEQDYLMRMRHARAYTLCCWGCDAQLSPRLLARFGPPALRQCAELIDRRAALVAKKPRRCQLVECTRMGCVGVGYDDGRSPTAMCFLCTEQWAMPRGVVAWMSALVRQWWPERIDGIQGWRPCPHCGAAIVKNGGCPMMRCALCRRTFRWGASRNSIHNVIEVHAPN